MAEQEPEVFIEVPRRYLIAKTKPIQFNIGKKLVEEAEGGKFRIPSVCLNQQTRQERGYLDYVSKNGNWVLEGVLYRQEANSVLTRTGLPYLHPKEAVLAHSQDREYTLEGCTKDEIDIAIAEGLEIDPKDLDTNGWLVSPCNEFGSDKYALWFFGGEGEDAQRSKRAEESGRWLIDSPQKIDSFIVRLDNQSYSKSVGSKYANQFWFWSLVGGSDLVGGRNWGRDLRYDGRVLGVFDSAEGAAPKK